MAARNGGNPHMATEHDGTAASLRRIALDALREVAGDPKAPAAARAQAFRTILEALGLLRSGDQSLERETGDRRHGGRRRPETWRPEPRAAPARPRARPRPPARPRATQANEDDPQA